jgi:glycosyltransferase involved in cell wall biosynthesis
MSTLENERLCVVIPAYNEAESIRECHRRLTAVLLGMHMPYELVFVNDGSSDQTLEILETLHAQDPQITLIDLSRNFGKEIALSAGLDMADGAAVVVIDADLQDPPELIPVLVAEWRNGFDVVYAQRTGRHGESWLKKATAHTFYRLIDRVSHIDVPTDAGDFRLLSRRAVLALRSMREQHRFMKGLFTWIGFPQKAVCYQRDSRFAGTTKWNYWRLWNLAIEGITSFTTIPLRISTYVGLLTALGAFFYGLLIIVRTLLYGNPVAGYPSLLVIVLFLGGMQLMAIGVIGEYLGRIFNETKQRPLYFLNSYKPGAGVLAPEPHDSTAHH